MAQNQKKKGLFITFEGGEGSGKTTQINWLAREIDKAGKDIRLTREPGGSLGGEIIRHVLLSGSAESFGPGMEAILFSAARSDNVETIIKPALENGINVICDRFFDSTRVYQGAFDRVNDTFLNALERIACNGIWPDITIILDINPEKGLARATQRRGGESLPDRFEKETLALHEKRRAAYLAIAKKEPDRCVVIDGWGTRQQVFNRILAIVRERSGLLTPEAEGGLVRSTSLIFHSGDGTSDNSDFAPGKGSTQND